MTHSMASLLEAYYLDLRVKNWSEGTISRRQYGLKRFVNWLADRSIDTFNEVTPEVIEAYQRSLYHIGNLRNRKPLRAATQASYLSTIVHLMRWLLKHQYIASNPTVELELPKEEFRLPVGFMNVEEVERLLNQADAQTPIGIRDRAMMEVLYSSAMRRGELCNLSHYDIDWERRLLTIRQGKNKKDRIVPIGQRAVDWLFKYLQDVRPELAAGKFAKRTCNRWRRDPTDKLFLSNFGAAMNPVNVSLLMRAYIEAAGIDKRGACHIFRHTAATLMLENGADLRSIQTLLGHGNLNTTQIYTHIAIDHLRKVHDATHPAKPDKSPGSVNP